jgi:hypothetical protein
MFARPLRSIYYKKHRDFNARLRSDFSFFLLAGDALRDPTLAVEC